MPITYQKCCQRQRVKGDVSSISNFCTPPLRFLYQSSPKIQIQTAVPPSFAFSLVHLLLTRVAILNWRSLISAEIYLGACYMDPDYEYAFNAVILFTITDLNLLE